MDAPDYFTCRLGNQRNIFAEASIKQLNYTYEEKILKLNNEMLFLLNTIFM